MAEANRSAEESLHGSDEQEQNQASANGAAAGVDGAQLNEGQPAILIEPDLSNEAVKRKEEILAKYRSTLESIQRTKRAKPDMVAYSQLREEWRPSPRLGHIPGVKVGESFNGRGELAILALHAQMMRGIDCLASEKRGAYAIVLAGGYKDDTDEGINFWYTGEGGQQSGRQVSDQKWTKGNEALRNNYLHQTPVRVFRGVIANTTTPQYLYEGLYMVKEAKMEASKDGPLVCKFLMTGMEQQSCATHKVEFGSVRKQPHGVARPVQLASLEPLGKRRRTTPASKEGVTSARALRLAEISKRAHLVCEDISGGKERNVPIPAFNEINDQKPPTDVEYVTDYVMWDGVMEVSQDLLKEADEAMMRFTYGCSCSLEFNRTIHEKDQQQAENYHAYARANVENYNDQGRLMNTDTFGVHECGESCKGKRCNGNKVVTRGITAPLELFMTANKGWGVRCAENLAAGEFVACYIGELLIEPMAERLRAADHYLFNLDHFTLAFQDIEREGLEKTLEEVASYKIPPMPPKNLHRLMTARLAARAQAAGLPATPLTGAAAAAGAPAANGAAAAAGSEEQQQEEQQQAAPDKAAAGGERAAAAEPASPAASADGAGPSAPTAAAGSSEAGTAASPSTSAPAAAAAADGAGPSGTPAAARSGQAQPGSAARAGPGQTPGGGDGEDSYEPLFVVDAMRKGNVARYINHSCDGNLVLQPVFAGRCRNVLYYYMALFCGRDIPKGEELTYSYGYHHAQPDRGGQGMVCNCGAVNCIGRLL